jgi:hypothetical protein
MASTISFFTSASLNNSDILRKYHSKLALTLAFVETVSKWVFGRRVHQVTLRPLFWIIPFDGFNLVKLQPIPSTTNL